MYETGFEWPLVLYLAVARVRLNWKLVWTWLPIVQRIITLWETARFLDPMRCTRVRQKIRRFVATTTLLPTRACVFRLPVNDKRTLFRVRRLLRGMQRALECRTSLAIASFVFEM